MLVLVGREGKDSRGGKELVGGGLQLRCTDAASGEQNRTAVACRQRRIDLQALYQALCHLSHEHSGRDLRLG